MLHLFINLFTGREIKGQNLRRWLRGICLAGPANSGLACFWSWAALCSLSLPQLLRLYTLLLWSPPFACSPVPGLLWPGVWVQDWIGEGWKELKVTQVPTSPSSPWPPMLSPVHSCQDSGPRHETPVSVLYGQTNI